MSELFTKREKELLEIMITFFIRRSHLIDHQFDTDDIISKSKELIKLYDKIHNL